MVTIREISVACNLSVSAVSKAINGYPDISEKKRKLILETAQRMGYVPNAAARALKTNRTFNLGVLLQDAANTGLLHRHFARVLESFRKRVESAGFDITLIGRQVGPEGYSYLDHCRYRDVDGVFIACVDFETPEIFDLAESKVPVVTLDRPFPGCSNVVSDNEGGMIQSVKHAASLGHERIAYIYGTPSYVTQCRRQGYRMGLEAAGIPLRPEYEVQGCYRDIEACGVVTRQLLALDEPPTAIIMTDDLSAWGGIAAIRDAGLRVPEDISVIGYDGEDFYGNMEKLTSINQNAEILGCRAAESLLRRIEDEAAVTDQVELVPIQLVLGETAARRI